MRDAGKPNRLPPQHSAPPAQGAFGAALAEALKRK
jgi:hypothetical protein